MVFGVGVGGECHWGGAWRIERLEPLVVHSLSCACSSRCELLAPCVHQPPYIPQWKDRWKSVHVRETNTQRYREREREDRDRQRRAETETVKRERGGEGMEKETEGVGG